MSAGGVLSLNIPRTQPSRASAFREAASLEEGFKGAAKLQEITTNKRVLVGQTFFDLKGLAMKRGPSPAEP